MSVHEQVNKDGADRQSNKDRHCFSRKTDVSGNHIVPLSVVYQEAKFSRVETQRTGNFTDSTLLIIIEVAITFSDSNTDTKSQLSCLWLVFQGEDIFHRFAFSDFQIKVETGHQLVKNSITSAVSKTFSSSEDRRNPIIFCFSSELTPSLATAIRAHTATVPCINFLFL